MPKRIAKAEVDQIVAMYRSGMSSGQVAEATGQKLPTVASIIQRRGLYRSHKDAARLCDWRPEDTRVDDAFFDTWTPASAWILGLIFGDGHIRQAKDANWINILGTEQVLRAAAKHLGHARGPSPHRSGARVWVMYAVTPDPGRSVCYRNS